MGPEGVDAIHLMINLLLDGNGHTMYDPAQRKLALASLKSARSGRLSSALDEVLRGDNDGRGGHGDARNGDVYDVLDEEEYREYVQRRREREDFVVDDGELTRLDSTAIDLTAIDLT